MANTYAPQAVGVTAPAGGFQNGGWYSGRQYYNGQVGDPGVIINPTQQGTGQAVSAEVNAQSAAAQGKTPQQLQDYLTGQAAKTATVAPTGTSAAPSGGGTTTPDMSGGGAAGDISGAFGTTTSTLNLPDLYNTLAKNAGISDMEAELTTKETAFNDQTSKINDNPWLSEADRTGRISKLTTDYNNDIKTTQDALTMAKQDIQTQIDLQTKQFDINSATAKAALDEFNTLLSSGALAGATGADIAAITKATGISSTEIQAAINSQTIKDTPTSVTTVDDGTNQYSVVINSKTGAIISKTVLAASKPEKATAGATTLQNQQQYESWVATDAANGATLEDIVSNYGGAGGLTVDDIYRIYNANSKYGPAKETIAQVKAGNYSNQQSFVQDTTAPGYTTPAKKPFNILDPSTWL